MRADGRAFEDAEGDLPLRCCLDRSAAGDKVMLVPYEPLQGWAQETGVDPGAYLERGPVFIHAHDCGGPGDGYPEAMHRDHRVFRAYDHQGRIRGGRVVRPGDGPQAIADWFGDPQVALIHVRAVEFGCFMFEVRR